MNYEKNFAGFFNGLADAVSSITLKYFRGALPVDEKDDRSPVTRADREIEEKLREAILKAFPDHGIVGEEFGSEKADAEFVWVIDPIDGTRAFMTGKPLFGTIIGLMHCGKPAVGLIDQAFTKERWFGVADKTALFNGKPIRVAPPRKFAEARLFLGAPETYDKDGDMAKFHALRHAARWQQYNADCYAYGLLAMGWVDAVVEKRLKIYDVAGVVPIVTGAGGFACNGNGNSIDLNFSDIMVAASSSELAMEALTLVI